MLAVVRGLFETDPHRVRRLDDTRLGVGRDGGRDVSRGRPCTPEPAAEQHSPARAQVRKVKLQARRAQDALAITPQARDLHAAERAADAWNVDPERGARNPFARALPVLNVRADV